MSRLVLPRVGTRVHPRGLRFTVLPLCCLGLELLLAGASSPFTARSAGHPLFLSAGLPPCGRCLTFVPRCRHLRLVLAVGRRLCSRTAQFKPGGTEPVQGRHQHSIFPRPLSSLKRYKRSSASRKKHRHRQQPRVTYRRKMASERRLSQSCSDPFQTSSIETSRRTKSSNFVPKRTTTSRSLHRNRWPDENRNRRETKQDLDDPLEHVEQREPSTNMRKCSQFNFDEKQNWNPRKTTRQEGKVTTTFNNNNKQQTATTTNTPQQTKRRTAIHFQA